MGNGRRHFCRYIFPPESSASKSSVQRIQKGKSDTVFIAMFIGKCRSFDKSIIFFPDALLPLQLSKRDITESLRDELSGNILDALLLIGL